MTHENYDPGIITIHMVDLKSFLDPKNAQCIVLRYLHDRGVEGNIGSDEGGIFISYYRPPDDVFEKFSSDFYHFVTNYKK